MSRQAFNQWLESGARPQRFFKRFLFYFVILVLASAVLDSLGVRFHWELFEERPFVSLEFWLRCFFLGFGLAIANLGRLTAIKDNSRL
jgi:hypothetical protein